jgi:hypothetical protein
VWNFAHYITKCFRMQVLNFVHKKRR